MKDVKDPILILLVLFILIGLAYVPLKKANLNKVSDTGTTSSSVGTANDDLGYSSNKKTAEEIKIAEESVKKLEENARKEAEKSRQSPYYGKLTMYNIAGLYSNDPSQQYISIYTNLNKEETLKITGWYVKSEVTGYYAVIPGAALLPFPFSKTESDIVLEQGDRVYLNRGFSPIGISFRTNKCIGYFEENRTFTPNLSMICPRAIDEKLPKFSSDFDRNDECLDLIERIPRCNTRGSSFIRDLPDTVTDSCKTYITTEINYNFCVANHFSDTDFPGNEYYVYLNRLLPIWRQRRDTIILYDQNGLIVDSLEY